MGKLINVVLSALVITLLLTSGAATVAGESRVPFPAITQGKGEQCVEPTPVMRREHMNFLRHQRDRTVRQGIRTKQHSLAGCIDCHVNDDTEGNTIPVNAPGQFCESCHAFTGVKVDCFGCHAATPDSGDASRSSARRLFGPGASGAHALEGRRFWRPLVAGFSTDLVGFKDDPGLR
jgi:hypothetical protein